MNGSSTINYSTNEQLIGKFHVTNIDKLSTEDNLSQTSVINPDESSVCGSRFQMIRVDRNFGRGRWKVNDYEPPESNSMSIINSNDNESINSSNLSTVITADSNTIPSAILAATNTAAAQTAFQQQQRIALNNTSNVIPTANVPPPTGLIHAYTPAALANQSYMLPNHHHHHHQIGYYPFYPSPYSPYAPHWAAAAALNSYLQPPTITPQQQQQTTSQLSNNTNLSDTVSDMNSENTFLNPTTDPLQNPQLLAYLYALQQSHFPYIPQTSSTTSSYATIPPYHPIPPPSHPTILPPKTLPISQNIPNNSTSDIQQSHQISTLTSPKTDSTKNIFQQSSSLITPKAKPLIPTISNNNDSIKTTTHVNDLLASSPAPASLISPINIATTTTTNSSTTATLNDIWSYTTSGSPLNLTQTAQTAAATAAVAMSLLNTENNQNREIANEFLKELTTPTKQNNTTDIDNKISAAMDLVKMHLLSAVREEVTELRQQIRTLNEKMTNIENENIFLRQHVSNEIYAQYIPTHVILSSSNDSTNSLTNNQTSIPSCSQSNSLSTNPSLVSQQSTLSTTNFPLT